MPLGSIFALFTCCCVGKMLIWPSQTPLFPPCIRVSVPTSSSVGLKVPIVCFPPGNFCLVARQKLPGNVLSSSKIALRFLVVVYAVMVVIDKIVNTISADVPRNFPRPTASLCSSVHSAWSFTGQEFFSHFCRVMLIFLTECGMVLDEDSVKRDIL